MIATLIAGAGFGVAFLGALRALSSAVPAEHRSAVMSAFYLVAYASLSVPAIIAGVLTTPVGLNATFEILGSLTAGIALVVAALAWRTRPRTAVTVPPAGTAVSHLVSTKARSRGSRGCPADRADAILEGENDEAIARDRRPR